jgi:hypothetical protein
MEPRFHSPYRFGTMPRPIEFLAGLEPEKLDEVLEILTSPRKVRAEAVRRYWERADARQVADVLMDLEVDDQARAQVIATLRRMTAARSA